jgi:hypothetical protein
VAKVSKNFRLAAAMGALPPDRGWRFTLEYPRLFRYSHPDNDYSVFFTPDWDGEGTLPIQVEDSEGALYEKYSKQLALPRRGRTAARVFALVRPTLDALLDGPKSSARLDAEIARALRSTHGRKTRGA